MSRSLNLIRVKNRIVFENEINLDIIEVLVMELFEVRTELEKSAERLADFRGSL